jgi:integrase/recombinase XerD
VKTLRRALADYLRVRRSLGFKLKAAGELLPGFLSHLEKAKSPIITTSLAVEWATLPQDVHPAWWTSRLVAVRGFAKYLQTIEPRHHVPPLELLPHRRARAAPYIYEPVEITALLAATTTLRNELRTETYRTFLGLLAVSGIRTGEAIALDDSDVDLRRGVLVIRKTKFGKTREVPLHRSTVRVLARYQHDRDRLMPRQRSPSLFISTAGTRLIYQNVHETFLQLVYAAGLGERDPLRPRIHDLRHTFAVRTVLAWHRAGEDVEAKLPMLSTYLGHIGPSSTYWYLTAIPALLESATARLERAWKVLS